MVAEAMKNAATIICMGSSLFVMGLKVADFANLDLPTGHAIRRIRKNANMHWWPDFRPASLLKAPRSHRFTKVAKLYFRSARGALPIIAKAERRTGKQQRRGTAAPVRAAVFAANG